MDVQVLSAVMGYGKSQHAISTIKSEPDNFYFVVLPYLDEVERYKECNEYLHDKNQLIDPSDEGGSKAEDLQRILRERQGSVVTTHKMLDHLKEEHINTIKKLPMRRGEKVLILDETIDLVKPVNSTKLPIEALRADVENEYIVVNETTGIVQWNYCKDSDGEGKYPHHAYLRDLCETGMLYFIDDRYMVMEVSLKFLECFDRVIVMTYRWEHSIMANYLKVNNVNWKMVPLNEKRVLDIYQYIVDHLEIPDDYSIDDIALSKNSMRDNIPEVKTAINTNIKAAMRDYSVPLEDTLYTTFKTIGNVDMLKWFKTLKIGRRQVEDASGDMVPASFLSHTIIGTNDFRHCRLMVYGLSKHMMPSVQSYFAKRGSSMPSSDWELSSMLQWLFRGCIRDHESGQKMVAAILCPRMRRMAQEWLSGIKRQVEAGKIDENKGQVVQLDAKTRRVKMQKFKQWKERNPEGACFSFDDYLQHGGPALKRMVREAS